VRNDRVGVGGWRLGVEMNEGGKENRWIRSRVFMSFPLFRIFPISSIFSRGHHLTDYEIGAGFILKSRDIITKF
jgi:hypothetical protein